MSLSGGISGHETLEGGCTYRGLLEKDHLLHHLTVRHPASLLRQAQQT